MADERITQAVKIVDPTTTSQEAAVDASGHLQIDIAAASATVTVDSELAAAGALTDNFSTPTTAPVGSFLMVYDGSTWDMGRGDASDGLLVNLGTNNDVVTELASAAALSDAFANPTTAPVGAFLMGFDGTDWERVRVTNTGQLHVDIQDSSIAVTNAGTFAVQEDGAALTALQLIDDPVATLGTTTYIEATTKGMIIGAVRNDTLATLADTDNELAPLQVNADGALYVDISDTSITVDTEFPAAAAITDNFANPTTTSVMAMGMWYDGSAWDMARGDATDGLLVNLGGNNDVTTELPTAAALADDTANPTVPGVGAFMLGWDNTNTNWNRVEVDDAGHLQVDVLTGGGTDTPTNAVVRVQNSTDTAAGSSADLQTVDLGGTTKKLAKVYVAASVAFKALVTGEEDGSTTTTYATLFGQAGTSIEWRPRHRDYGSKTFGANAGFDGFQVEVTNLDTSQAADLHACIMYED